MDQNKKIKLWKENKFDQQYEMSFQDLLDKFEGSKHNDQIGALQSNIAVFIGSTDGLNSTFESQDFEALIDFRLKEYKPQNVKNEQDTEKYRTDAFYIVQALQDSHLDDMHMLDDSIFGKNVFVDQSGEFYVYFSNSEFQELEDDAANFLLNSDDGLGFNIIEDDTPFYVISLKDAFLDKYEEYIKSSQISKQPEKIVKALFENSTGEEIMCGDTWIEINHPNYKEGILVGIEYKELVDDGNDEYDENVFFFHGYENRHTEEGSLTSNYQLPLFAFDMPREEIEKIGQSKNTNIESYINQNEASYNTSASLELK